MKNQGDILEDVDLRLLDEVFEALDRVEAWLPRVGMNRQRDVLQEVLKVTSPVDSQSECVCLVVQGLQTQQGQFR